GKYRVERRTNLFFSVVGSPNGRVCIPNAQQVRRLTLCPLDGSIAVFFSVVCDRKCRTTFRHYLDTAARGLARALGEADGRLLPSKRPPSVRSPGPVDLGLRPDASVFGSGEGASIRSMQK